MQVQRRSIISGKVNTMDLPVTVEQLTRHESKLGLVQDIFPHLDAGQREFLMTGITPAEWDATFCAEED